MSYTPELSPEADNFLKLGKLFDATGFSGEGGQFELFDFVDAASEVIPYHSDTEEYDRYIRNSLSSESRKLQQNGYTEDKVASYMLGSVMWRISSSESSDIPQKELRALLARSVYNIAQSRQAFGRGDEKLFHFAFANYTESFGQDYEPATKRSLRKLCHYIEHTVIDSRRAVMPVVERERSSIWHHVLNGMAIIEMKEGYTTQPPPEQTDENGTWQLPPHERDEEDNA